MKAHKLIADDFGLGTHVLLRVIYVLVAHFVLYKVLNNIKVQYSLVISLQIHC